MSTIIYMIVNEDLWGNKLTPIACYLDKELAEAHASLANKKLKEHLKLVKARKNRSTTRKTQKLMGGFYKSLHNGTFISKYIVVEYNTSLNFFTKD